MKSVFLIFIVFLPNVVFANDTITSPVEFSVYSFCTVNKYCEIFVTLENKTSYKVDMTSLDFYQGKLKLSAFKVYDAIKYRLQEIENKDIEQALVINRSIKEEKAQYINDTNSIIFKPFERVSFKFKGIQNTFNLQNDHLYILEFYTPFANFYLDGSYIGTRSVESSFSELRIPKKIK